MGINNITEVSNGDICTADSLNQYKDALTGDVVPRNSAGTPTNISGSIGSNSFKWLRSQIKGGCWSTGDIKAHHTFDGAAPIAQGWFPCNGDVINQASYDAIFSEGDWETYIRSSLLDGKNSPNLINKYLTGAANTTQTGDVAITSVGNADNETSMIHSHTSSTGHNHQWYSAGTGSAVHGINTVSGYGPEQTYNSSGSAISLPTSGSGMGGSCWTNNVSASTQNSLSSPVDIQPESIETIYLIRIV